MKQQERRARLVARHHLARSAKDVSTAVRALVAAHSSDPLTPYLAARARVPGFTTEHLHRAIVEEKCLWRMHGMRRTLFVVATDDAPIVLASASRDIAKKERARVEKWIVEEIGAKSAARWLAKVEARVLDVLADGKERRTQDLTAAIPELATEITLGSGRWMQRAPVSSRLLFVMAMEGRIVRTSSPSWRSSQYRWTTTSRWFGAHPDDVDPAAARADLVRRYLESHGPATQVDVRWWTGWTTKHTATALRDVGARAIPLEGGGEGFVLPDDLDRPRRVARHIAFLPALDSTPMGWKERDWFLGPHATRLFDKNGNVGPTVWVDGRIVGGWAQRPDGEVVYELLEAVGKEAVRRVAAEAAALTDWMSGVVTIPRFRTPLERELSSR